MLAEPGGAAKAAQMYRDARRRDPNAYLFPETALNLAGYDRLQQNRSQEAVELFKLNAEAYPASANTYDSLSDGYIALGLSAEALAAEQKCLELLSADNGTDEFKQQLRQTAEEKLAKLKEQSSRQ
jgi:tetratricopeptide (TPR) repeat protein